MNEPSAAQSHFNGLSRVLGELPPTDAGAAGEWYCFERGAWKDTSANRAVVWKRGCFTWEYKGSRADLDAAFNQFRKYALALEKAPLLIGSGMAQFRTRDRNRHA
ncbi:MAG: hypothetical protein OXB98_22270 [Bryobacterales bacterium]|nr:hypothetical protein [Bryobacterales bacterium]